VDFGSLETEVQIFTLLIPFSLAMLVLSFKNKKKSSLRESVFLGSSASILFRGYLLRRWDLMELKWLSFTWIFKLFFLVGIFFGLFISHQF